MANLKPLMRQNFLEYASYVIVDRAIPDLRDGFKPVQRRILATLKRMDDGKFHKVANVIGDTMKLHPHGDQSIGDALVVLANKEYFIERQGNFGSVLTGHRAAAARYIECRLTPLARETLFNHHLTTYTPSYDGRRDEPLFLPAKLPVVLMLGAEGIAVGLSTRILPHNFCELLEAQIAILKRGKFKLLPDFSQGGRMDASEYGDGNGKVRVRARIEERSNKLLVITEIPFGTTTESLIASIETASQRGKIKVGSIQDFTTDRAEIHLALPRGVSADETLPQLWAYTDCEVTLHPRLTVIDDRHPVDLSVSDLLRELTKRLKAIIKAELEHELAKLTSRKHWLTLEQIFIEERVYKALEKAKTAEAVRKTVWTGMKPFTRRMIRKMTEDDVTKLLQLHIRRISAYDIQKFRDDMGEIERNIRAVNRKLKNLTKTTIGVLEDLLDRYGKDYPRRTEITTFGAVDKRKVARQSIRVAYDPKSGFWGSSVRASEHAMTMSEYDRALIVSSDGSYRIVGPEEKRLIPGKVVYCQPFDEKQGLHVTVVYRNAQKFAFGKRIHIHKFVRAREYTLCKVEKGKKGKLDFFLLDDDPGCLFLAFVHKPRQRVKDTTYDLNTLVETSVGARGARLAPKPVSRMKRVARD